MFYAHVMHDRGTEYASMEIESFKTKKERDCFVDKTQENYGEAIHNPTNEETDLYYDALNNLKQWGYACSREDVIDAWNHESSIVSSTTAEIISAKDAKLYYKDYIL